MWMIDGPEQSPGGGIGTLPNEPSDLAKIRTAVRGAIVRGRKLQPAAIAQEARDAAADLPGCGGLWGKPAEVVQHDGARQIGQSIQMPRKRGSFGLNVYMPSFG